MKDQRAPTAGARRTTQDPMGCAASHARMDARGRLGPGWKSRADTRGGSWRGLRRRHGRDMGDLDLGLLHLDRGPAGHVHALGRRRGDGARCPVPATSRHPGATCAVRGDSAGPAGARTSGPRRRLTRRFVAPGGRREHFEAEVHRPLDRARGHDPRAVSKRVTVASDSGEPFLPASAPSAEV